MASSSSSSGPPPPWVILNRIARVQHDAVEGPFPSPSLELADPPYISQLTLSTSAHPKPIADGADKCLYVIAANDSGVLLHVSRDPFIRLNLSGTAADPPPQGNLVLARHFLPAADGHSARFGTSVRIPSRELFQLRIFNVASIGLLPVPGTGGADFVVAELFPAPRSSLVTFCSRSGAGVNFWEEEILTCPIVWGTWTPHDVIAHDGKLWWTDLTQGLLGCNVLDHTPQLRYVELPEIFAVKGDKPGNEVRWYRFVGASNGQLRFVDFRHNQEREEPPEKTVVVVWTLDCDPFAEDDDVVPGQPRWELLATTTLGIIWASNSYEESRMPKEVPVLAFVHPDKPHVVYFFLTKYMFAVDVSSSEVVEFVRDLRQPRIDHWRNCLLPWVLPPSRPNGI
ncbi:hypothetical protein QOZ80_2BG0189070 [Eleusine coracana subsp. coracana]|nr:hypothetical protein QOZ80_2BG0189070 [Eleusine coracana subsp. coracana]